MCNLPTLKLIDPNILKTWYAVVLYIYFDLTDHPRLGPEDYHQKGVLDPLLLQENSRLQTCPPPLGRHRFDVLH